MSVASHVQRLDLTGDFEVPTEPLAMDVRDANGRLVVKSGEVPSRSLLERLRKMGILEVFVRSPEASAPDYWQKWGAEWLEESRSRLVYLTPDIGVTTEELDRFIRILSEAVESFVREKNQSKAG
ncbi:MAG: hypothetical protein M0T83_02970 [Nitrospiraceae bacterium]|jgi:hypothetical protein|nr:hypothetical protein [Nitrospiraceae bacterium]